VAVALRATLLVSLDDLLAVVREFLNPNVSRSGLEPDLKVVEQYQEIMIHRF
jgi:hypothetical protein